MKTLKCGLSTGLLAMALTFGSASFAVAHEDDLDGRIRDYILENPQIIVEALEVLSAREAQAVVQRKLAAYPDMFTQPPELGLGAVDAPIRVVEFFDYRCAPCKEIHPELAALVQANPNLRIDMRHLPILSPGSERATRFALAVLDQYGPEAYEKAHKRLWDLRGPLNMAGFATIARAENLDLKTLETAMHKDWISQRISQNRDMAIDLEIRGTPAFLSPNAVTFGAGNLAELSDTWLGN